MTDSAAFSAPPSFAQQRMWILEQFEGDASVYNVQAGFRIRGPLNLVVLRRALDEIVARHEVLRTRLVNASEGLVQVVQVPEVVAMEIADRASVDPEMTADPDATIARIAAAEARRGFDLSCEPPLRACLLRIAEDHHALIVTFDHLVCDAASLGVFNSELCALYASFLFGRPSPLAEPEIQYADYAAWQREWMEGPESTAQLDYWVKRLHPPPPRPVFPMSRSRKRSAAATTRVQSLPDELIARLRDLIAGERTSLFGALLAAFSVVLNRATSEPDIVVGNLLEGRTQPELERLIGFFVNSVALRVDLSGDPTFAELLSRVHDTTLDAYAHQDVPFDRVIEELRPEREPGRPPLFDVVFQFAEFQRPAVTLPGGSIELLWLQPLPAPVDLVVGVIGEDGQHRAEWDYNQGLFSEATITRLQGHFRRVLETAAAAPQTRVSEFVLVDGEERENVLGLGAGGPAERGLFLHQDFAESVQQSPGATALAVDGVTVTYQDIDQWSNTLALRLRAAGVGPGTVVGLFLRRGLDLMISVLAVAKAGGAFLPLDPAYPAERLKLMLDDARPAVVLSNDELAALLPGDARVETTLRKRESEAANPFTPTEVDQADIAYVIYTSGSTGRPKGTAVTHGGVAAIIGAQRNRFALGPKDRVLQFASPSFDASVFEFLLAFGSGATLVVSPAEGLSPADLADFLREHAVTTVVLPPAALAQVPEDAELPALHTVIVAGEACPPALAARWQRGRRFFNLYGPTETTIWATAHPVVPADAGTPTLPIGTPVRGTTAYVLDSRLELAPLGVPGELVIGGCTVARGYLGRPSLTADSFVPDPFDARPGARMYRTGDLVQWREDGLLEFLGRIDHQVKLHGFRIELGEVESRLVEHPHVLEAVAMVREDTPGHKVLTAYLVAAVELTSAELRRHCGGTLPEFMVPGAFVNLEALPLSPSGKIDRRALPRPEDAIAVRDGAASEIPFTAPRTQLEQLVAEIWGEVLGRDGISAFDDFFALGGHSLAATRVINRFRAEFDVRIPVRVLFEAPVLAAFTEAVAVVIAPTLTPEADA